MERECACDVPKQFHLIFDGGTCGTYAILVCNECYDDIDKEFLLKEEKI